MQKAILVKYLGPTNTKGTRWKAMAQGGANLTLSRDYELEGDADARRVADALREKMQWRAIYGAGSLPNGDYVFTLGE